jgi:hypothetical protein
MQTKYLHDDERAEQVSVTSKNKYFLEHRIGNAKADSSKGVIELNFDLLDKKIYMSIYPRGIGDSLRSA